MKNMILSAVLISNLLIGTIYDSDSLESLAGVKISTNTYSNLDGKFTIEVDPKDTLQLDLISYNKLFIAIDSSDQKIITFKK